MMNFQSLCAVIAMFCLLLTVIALVCFGIDWWAYCHSAGKTASHALDYQKLYSSLIAFAWGVLFFALWYLQDIPFQRARRRARDSRPTLPTTDPAVTGEMEDEPASEA